jgi:DNA-binding Lrp family transcriptional regulator
MHGDMTDPMGKLPVDGTDRRLLALLRENARAPVAELARQLGLSRTTVQSRIERLEKTGVIAGYTVRVADEHERGLIRAYIMVTLRPKLSASVESALRRMPEVRALHSVSGTFDLVVVTAATSAGELNAVIDRIGALEGVERTTSAVILSTRIER